MSFLVVLKAERNSQYHNSNTQQGKPYRLVAFSGQSSQNTTGKAIPCRVFASYTRYISPFSSIQAFSEGTLDGLSATCAGEGDRPRVYLCFYLFPAGTSHRVRWRAVEVTLNGSGGEGCLLLRGRRVIGRGEAMRVQEYAVRVSGHLFLGVFRVFGCWRRGWGLCSHGNRYVRYTCTLQAFSPGWHLRVGFSTKPTLRNTEIQIVGASSMM